MNLAYFIEGAGSAMQNPVIWINGDVSWPRMPEH